MGRKGVAMPVTLFTDPWVIVRHDGPFMVKEKGEGVAYTVQPIEHQNVR